MLGTELCDSNPAKLSLQLCITCSGYHCIAYVMLLKANLADQNITVTYRNTGVLVQHLRHQCLCVARQAIETS